MTQFRIDARIPAGALISEGYIVRKFIALVIALLVLLSAGAPALAQAVGPAPVVTLSIMPSISSLAFGPGDRWFVTGGWDNTVKIWETASGRLLRTLSGHSKVVQAVAVSPDGRLIASAGWDDVIKVWNVQTGESIRSINNDSSTTRLAFSPDGRSLFAQGIYVLRRYDVASGAVAQTYHTVKQPDAKTSISNAFAISPDGRLIAGGRGCDPKPDDQCTIAIWDVGTGRLLRKWTSDRRVFTLAFSPDGRWLVSCSSGPGQIDLWDAFSGSRISQFPSPGLVTRALAFSPDSRSLFAAGDWVQAYETATGHIIWSGKLRDNTPTSLVYGPTLGEVVSAGHYVSFWDPASGEQVRSVKGPALPSDDPSVIVLPDGTWMASAAPGLTTWDPANGAMLKRIGPELGRIFSLRTTPDRHWLAAATFSQSVKIWDVTAGKLTKEFNASSGYRGVLLSAAMSNDGRSIATALGSDNAVRIWDAQSGQLVRAIPAYASWPTAVAFSLDGRTLVSAGIDSGPDVPLKFWDLATGALLRSYSLENMSVGKLAYSADGRWLYSSGISRESFKLLDPQTGRPVRGFRDNSPTGDFAQSPDGRFIATIESLENQTKLWDAASGRLLFDLKGNYGTERSVMFSQDSRKVIVITSNGVLLVWSTETGDLLTVTVQSDAGEWVTITPEGFFAASDKGAQLLHVVQGFETTGIDQVYQSLYRPDLVREKLAGDPKGLVREAAAKLDLNKVIASGAAPEVAMTSPTNGASEKDRVTVEARVTDKGGGVGRIEWRVNGTTFGVDEASAAVGSGTKKVTRTLTLDEGDNTIEVVAYNAKNLIASMPGRVRVTSAGAVATPPRLFVLAVGIDDYYDSRLRLNFPVADAKALVAGFEAAGKGLYESVNVTTVLDADATKAKIGAKFADIAVATRPRDVFVFFMAGHGKTEDGRYYFIPQNFRYDSDSAVAQQGISQNELQAWLAQIRAKKSLLLFDTCESGSLTEDKVGARGLEGIAAIERLTRAMGRSVLSASTDDAPALEGYKGHGVFTYALLDAMGRADTDSDGLIEVTQLASFVDAEVPEISQRAFNYRQIPQMKLVGSNFPLVREVAVLDSAADALVVSRKPTHVTIRAADVLPQPSDSTPTQTLEPGTTVTVMKSEQGWVLIAKDGNPLGYVAASTLVPIH